MSSGGYETPEFQRGLQAAIDKKHRSLAETLSKFCPVDGVALRGGHCAVCGRVFPMKSDEGPTDSEIASLDEQPEPSEAAVQAAAKRLFEERLERQRAERERVEREQAKPRPRTHLPPEEDAPPRRNWEKFVTPDGRLRPW